MQISHSQSTETMERLLTSHRKEKLRDDDEEQSGAHFYFIFFYFDYESTIWWWQDEANDWLQTNVEEDRDFLISLVDLSRQ